MKLSECNIGKIVCTSDNEVGHIVGLGYNIQDKLVKDKSNKELYNHVVPIVRFHSGERTIHHTNIYEL